MPRQERQELSTGESSWLTHTRISPSGGAWAWAGVLLAKVFGSQSRDIARYRQENQRLAELQVRQQMIGQGFYAVVQSFLSITPAAIYLITGLLLANGNAISAGTVPMLGFRGR